MNIRDQITKLQDVIEFLESVDQMFSGRANAGGKGRKRKLSAKARAAISEAQRRRWAKVRAGKKGKKSAKKKPVQSASAA
jgi:hypothetical protein